MYTKQEYLTDLENKVQPYLAKIDSELRKGNKYISLGFVSLDMFRMLTNKIEETLKEAGWRVTFKTGNTRQDEDNLYVKVS